MAGVFALVVAAGFAAANAAQGAPTTETSLQTEPSTKAGDASLTPGSSLEARGSAGASTEASAGAASRTAGLSPGASSRPGNSSPAQPSSSPAPTWSVGAGIGLAGLYGIGGLYPIGGSSDLGTALSAVHTSGGVSVERAVSRRAWLMLDFSGEVGADTIDGTGEDVDYRAGMLMLGVRHQAAKGGIVDLSVWGGVSFSAYSRRAVAAEPLSGSTETVTTSGTGLGVTAGIALDRKLLDALSLRLSLAMFQASHTWAQVEREAADTAKGNAFQVDVGLAPSLQLWLAI